MKRFRVVNMSDAHEANYPDTCEYDKESCFNGLYEFDKDGKAIRLVATDHGEPEDNSFTRDYSWIVEELNKLDNEHK